MTTPAMWHEDFLKTVPGLPMYGWNYWAKYIYGDIAHWVAPELSDLNTTTFVGTGAFQQLEYLGYSFPQKNPRERQLAGMKALRELQGKANAKLERGELGDNMDPLSTYDTQVQCCLCKRRRKSE